MTQPSFAFEPHATPVEASERAARIVNPGFGRVFTDHMATIRWSEDKGWHDAKITARAPIVMDPAAAVLHYAQEIFEGLKAYTLPDGGVALFRAEQNAARFRRSAKRLAMAELPERRREAFVLHSIDGLTQTEVAQRMGISRRMVHNHVTLAMAYCELRVQYGSAEDMRLMQGLLAQAATDGEGRE